MNLRNRMRYFRWDRYYPWYALADGVIMGAIISALLWWLW
jgi:hypothetical protein